MENDIDILTRKEKQIKCGNELITIKSPSLLFYIKDLPNIMKDVGKDIFLLAPAAKNLGEGKDIDWALIIGQSASLMKGIVIAIGKIIGKDEQWMFENLDLAGFCYLLNEVLDVIEIKRVSGFFGKMKSKLQKETSQSGNSLTA